MVIVISFLNLYLHMLTLPLKCCNYILGHCVFGVQELLKDASSQYQIQRKAKSVIKVCSDDLGMDDVEAERIILLAGESILGSKYITVVSVHEFKVHTSPSSPWFDS